MSVDEKAREGDKPRVLVVDGDPLYLRVWEKIFRGITDCHYALTNDPAMVQALVAAQPIDLVISDVVMAGCSGYDLARYVQTTQPGAQIVLTTAYDCNLKNFNLDDPKFHILYKPYRNITDIQRFIQHLLRRENVFEESSEDSFSENELFPHVTEWYL